MFYNWNKSKFTHLSMIIILIISISGLFLIEKTKTLAPDSAYSTRTFNTSTFENRPKPYHLPGLVIFYF